MTPPLVETLRRLTQEERQQLAEASPGRVSRRRLARAVASRLAELAVNALFPTNGSGNNMSRG